MSAIVDNVLPRPISSAALIDVFGSVEVRSLSMHTAHLICRHYIEHLSLANASTRAHVADVARGECVVLVGRLPQLPHSAHYALICTPGTKCMDRRLRYNELCQVLQRCANDLFDAPVSLLRFNGTGEQSLHDWLEVIQSLEYLTRLDPARLVRGHLSKSMAIKGTKPHISFRRTVPRSCQANFVGNHEKM